MRKFMFVLALVVSASGFASAQGWRSSDQPVTVTGTLGIQNGRIMVSSGGAVYYVPVLERYAGFIDSLKEGAQISLDGYVSKNGGYAWIQPAKVTINGKDYDFSVNTSPGLGRGGRNYGYGASYGGCGHDGYGYGGGYGRMRW